MPIRFYCENCKRKIKAPDDSGGKYGNCPHCNHRCYIPRPRLDDEDELKLTPVDESEETRYEQLMTETRNLTLDILHQAEGLQSPPASQRAADERELTRDIIVYLRQMADGQLDDAQTTVEKIVPYRPEAIQILDRLSTSERQEPELADIPPEILSRLIKNLRTRMS
jgi:DNA-directed RNA polymerase subunit RPC12/RpoP